MRFGNDITDEELARQAQAGSLEAFEELVFRHEKAIFQFARQLCHNETSATEITQDTFVRAYEKLAQFDPARSFRGWLFAIARNKGYDHLQGGKVRVEGDIPEGYTEDDPARAATLADEAENVWKVARKTLSADAFQALWLRYAQDMDLPEIARVLGKSKISVKVILFRARKQLAHELTRQHSTTARTREPVSTAGRIVPATSRNL